MKTIKEMAQDALDVQNAVNLSGVIHTFSRVMTDLRARLQESPEGFSTDKLNQHPICVLFSSKISSLTNSDSGTVFSQAYHEVTKLSE